MEHPITLWLSDEDHAALVAGAARYHRTPEEHLMAWIADALATTRQQFSADRWDVRRRVLERDAALAATVDAAANGGTPAVTRR